MRWPAVLAACIGAAALALPASARSSFVIDNAHLLSAATVSQVDAKVSDFNAQTHKEVVVDTEPTVVGGSGDAAAERIFAQQQINGVLIYVAKQPKTIGVYVDRSSAKFFPPGSTTAIRNAIRSSFNSGDFDGGINNGVDLALSQYRSHLNALPRTRAEAPAGAATQNQAGGFNMSWIWWLIVLAVIFFIVRGVFRAMAGPRIYPPGGGGPGYGGPGYGPGYGGGGGFGGGGFWSGMLGGLGGAWLGNELFGRGGWGGGGNVEPGAGTYAGMDPGAQQDASGWQSDPGQIDMGDSSSGSWGDSGGGWGGGDSGGGWGGGDSGGGGGDGGGGW